MSTQLDEVPRNPIYLLVKDILAKTASDPTKLRLASQQVWQTLTQQEMVLLETITSKSPPSSDDCAVSSGSTPESDKTSSFSKIQCELEPLFGDKPEDAVFTIMSSHVFVHQGNDCIPAEIGIVKYSFREGVIDSFHSLIQPGPIPKLFIADALDMSDNHHRIPLDGLSHSSGMQEVVHNMHRILHYGPQHNGWVFIEDDEFEQTMAVVNTLISQFTIVTHFDWQLKFVKLSSLWRYMKKHVKEDIAEQDEWAFKTWRYAYQDLCYHHDAIDHPVCALSQAHKCSFVLSKEFVNKLKLDLIPGRHMPIQSYWSY